LDEGGRAGISAEKPLIMADLGVAGDFVDELARIVALVCHVKSSKTY
jgi:hypothetical protein